MLLHPIANFVLFQACWLANVAGAGAGWPALGPALTAVWIALHLAAMRERRAGEAGILAAAALLGYAADSALVLAGSFQFPAHTLLGGPSPLWMVALWVGFAATLRHGLRWLKGRYLLGAILGLIAGPLAYRAGQALNAIEIPDPGTGLAAVGIEWMIAMPLLLIVAARADLHSGRNITEPGDEQERSG